MAPSPVIVQEDDEDDLDLLMDEEEPREGSKGSYHLVRLSDGESASVGSSCDESFLPGNNKYIQLLHRNLVSDSCFTIGSVKVLDGVEAVRLVKFIVLTFCGILTAHYFVRLVDWEHDKDYTIQDMLMYDVNYIILDIGVFFMVGRLFQKRGVDDLAWIGIACMAMFYQSWTTTRTFLRYSVSLYEIHCVWPITLWIFCGVLIPLIVVVVFKHVQHAVSHQMLVVKLVEITLTIVFMLVPVMGDPNFHFHHWYASWMIGMHTNFDTWWSRATMAWYDRSCRVMS